VAQPALIFDLDDTLYPELEYVHSGFRAVAESFAPRLGLSAEVMRQELEHVSSLGPATGVFDRWLEGSGFSPAGLLEPMIGIFRSHVPRLHLFCDARWALDNLAVGFRLALLTDGRPLSQRYKLAALGIEAAFQAILVTDEIDISCRKPSPRGFQLLLEQLNVAPSSALYVGDNPLKDFRGAKQLGMATVRVRRPCGIHREAEAPGPDYAPDAEVTSLLELPGLFPDLVPPP
jgi:putative hydrolase of the HAD superfamily